jgi:putative hydrolase of the HAD superfamily
VDGHINVVFDFGAVLFTWKPAELLAASFPQQAGDAKAAANLAHAVFGHVDWHSFDRGTLTMDEVVARTADRLALDAAVLGEMVASISDHLAPIAATVDILERLHRLRSQKPGLRLYYLSNMPVPYARELEQRHAFLQWFDGGIFSGDAKASKPDPAVYGLLQTRYALDPAQTVFIDDLKANVQVASDLGWLSIHFESARQLQTRLEALAIMGEAQQNRG